MPALRLLKLPLAGSRPAVFAAALLAVLAAPSSAQNQIGVCTIGDHDGSKAEDKKKPAGDERDAAGSPGGAFGFSVMDAMAMSSQDALTQRAVREDARRTATRSDPGGRAAVASRESGRNAGTLPTQRVPVLEASSRRRPPLFESGAVAPGSAEDARGVHNGDSATVYEPARSGALISLAKSPSLITKLGRMSAAAQKAARKPDPDSARENFDRLWGRSASTPDGVDGPARDDTRFFGR